MTLWDGGGNDTLDLSNYGKESPSTCVPAHISTSTKTSSPTIWPIRT